MRRLPIVIAQCIALGACGANVHSIFRTTETPDGGKIVLQDAKQRAILISRADPLDGGKEHNGKKTIRRDIACAEPSPDALSAFAAAAEGNVDIAEQIAAAIQAGTNETTASIGLRTASVQSLRDAMFRVCEAYAAGAITGREYSGIIRRFQNILLGLIAIEQITNTIAPPPVKISGAQNNKNDQADSINIAERTIGEKETSIAVAQEVSFIVTEVMSQVAYSDLSDFCLAFIAEENNILTGTTRESISDQQLKQINNLSAQILKDENNLRKFAQNKVPESEIVSPQYYNAKQVLEQRTVDREIAIGGRLSKDIMIAQRSFYDKWIIAERNTLRTLRNRKFPEDEIRRKQESIENHEKIRDDISSSESRSSATEAGYRMCERVFARSQLVYVSEPRGRN